HGQAVAGDLDAAVGNAVRDDVEAVAMLYARAVELAAHAILPCGCRIVAGKEGGDASRGEAVRLRPENDTRHILARRRRRRAAVKRQAGRWRAAERQPVAFDEQAAVQSAEEGARVRGDAAERGRDGKS